MLIKKILSVFATVIIILFYSHSAYAADYYKDNKALTEILNQNTDAAITLSEYHTGKIIAENTQNKTYSYKNLINNLTLFILSEKLKSNEITLDTMINIKNDAYLTQIKIGNTISVKDAIFLLLQGNSITLATSILEHYTIGLDDIKVILNKLTLTDTSINQLAISEDNITTSKNLSYLTHVTLKNYPEILDISKHPEYTTQNEEKITNSIIFKASNSIRVLGLNYYGNNGIFVAYSGNTRIILTILDITEEKEAFFDKLQNLYQYIFDNYTYKLAITAGTYDINNENISIKSDIYDLFFKEHSDANVRYFLMNKKILLFQNYEPISANLATVYTTYDSNTDISQMSKLKNSFIQDKNFQEKSNEEKFLLLFDRSQFFFAFALAIYTSIFIILYVLKKPFDKGDN